MSVQEHNHPDANPSWCTGNLVKYFPRMVGRCPTTIMAMLALTTLKFHANLDWTAICALLNRHHHDDLRRTARFEEVFEERLTELGWDRMRRAKRKPVAIAVAEQGFQQREAAQIPRRLDNDDFVDGEK